MRSSIDQNKYSTATRLAEAYRRGIRTRFRIGAARLLFSLLIAVILVSSNFLLQVHAADGDLDLGFGAGGKVITDFSGGADWAFGIAVQTDGKIILGGRTEIGGSSDFGVSRYNSDGTLDVSFGTSGKAKIDFYGFNDGCFALALQSDGKIVAAGGAFGAAGDNNFAMTRLNPDGSIDASFGTGGKVSEDLNSGSNDEAISVAIQNDGKIIACVGQAVSQTADWIVVRYNSDGTPDAGFGIGGKVTTDFFGDDDGAGKIAIQNDGKIVVAGYAGFPNGINDFAVARYNPDGSPDATFGIGGKVTTDFFGESDSAFAVVIQNDGKILTAGLATPNIFDVDFALVRYNSDGTLDGSFGVGGLVTTDFFGGLDSVRSVVLQCDGKILAAGTAYDNAADFALARYDTNGILDPTFGNAGKVTTNIVGSDFATDMTMQGDGKIVMSGFSSDDFLLTCHDNSGGCATFACPEPHGHWKNNPSTWPADTLTLGGKAYAKSELLALLKVSTQTDASVILARQLIAAKLNIESGSDPAPVNSTITDADSLLSGYAGKLPYKVKPSSASGQAMSAYSSVLGNYNNGLLTPTCQ